MSTFLKEKSLQLWGLVKWSWQKLTSEHSIATLTALVLAVQTVIFFRQTTILQNQTNFMGTATRPFIHNSVASTTSLFEIAFLRKPLNLENAGGVPGVVIYEAAIADLDSGTLPVANLSGSHLGVGNLVVIYPESSGEGMFFNPPIWTHITSSSLAALQSGSDTIEIADCIVYKSLESGDDRRWEINELWLLASDHGEPLLSNETPTTTDSCDPEVPFAEYKY